MLNPLLRTVSSRHKLYLWALTMRSSHTTSKRRNGVTGGVETARTPLRGSMDKGRDFDRITARVDLDLKASDLVHILL